MVRLLVLGTNAIAGANTFAVRPCGRRMFASTNALKSHWWHPSHFHTEFFPLQTSLPMQGRTQQCICVRASRMITKVFDASPPYHIRPRHHPPRAPDHTVDDHHITWQVLGADMRKIEPILRLKEHNRSSPNLLWGGAWIAWFLIEVNLTLHLQNPGQSRENLRWEDRNLGRAGKEARMLLGSLKTIAKSGMKGHNHEKKETAHKQREIREQTGPCKLETLEEKVLTEKKPIDEETAMHREKTEEKATTVNTKENRIEHCEVANQMEEAVGDESNVGKRLNGRSKLESQRIQAHRAITVRTFPSWVSQETISQPGLIPPGPCFSFLNAFLPGCLSPPLGVIPWQRQGFVETLFFPSLFLSCQEARKGNSTKSCEFYFQYESDDKPVEEHQWRVPKDRRRKAETPRKDACDGNKLTGLGDVGSRKRIRREKETDVSALSSIGVTRNIKRRHRKNIKTSSGMAVRKESKRPMSRLPANAVERFRQVFAENELPSMSSKVALSKQLDLPYRQVHMWFKNARYMALKKKKMKNSKIAAPSCSENSSACMGANGSIPQIREPADAGNLYLMEMEKMGNIEVKLENIRKILEAVSHREGRDFFNNKDQKRSANLFEEELVMYVPVAELREKILQVALVRDTLFDKLKGSNFHTVVQKSEV
eukprot:Gb_17968 [translate_table: standard]